jgi:F-type H+-transporting ATPase subunit gamma
MAGNLKEVRIRIQSVMSTMQITKAMKMVSAAKLRRATERITQIRPYSDQLQNVMVNIVRSLQGEINLSFAQQRPVNRVLIVVITSDKGLCGGFNANTAKATRTLLQEDYADLVAKGGVDILTVGKKGYDWFKSSKLYINKEFTGLFGQLNIASASEAAEYIMNAYSNGGYDKVLAVYGKFKNAATQITTVEQFLPIAIPQGENTEAASDYIFEPDKAQILQELVPKILKTQFYRFLLDSNASEHGARMTAMDKATENAGEILRELRISYNRARQAAITTELTEIVSGAAALSEG